MAQFSLHVDPIRRAAGESAVANLAYITATAARDERTGELKTYARKKGLLATGAVGWDGDLASLGNGAEAAEKRKDAMVGRKAILALPHELDQAAHECLIREYAEWLRERHMVAVVWAYHDAPARAEPGHPGDPRNKHVHLWITTRRVVAGQFCEKTRELDVKTTSAEHVAAWRKQWEAMNNAELERAGVKARVDARSHATKWREEGREGPAPAPNAHLGAARSAVERKGRKTRAGAYNRHNEATLADRARLKDRHDRLELAAGEARSIEASEVQIKRAVAALRASASPRMESEPALAAAMAFACIIREALSRWRRRRLVPREMRLWWRLVEKHQAGRRVPADRLEQARRRAWALLVKRWPDPDKRRAILRAAEATLPPGLQRRLRDIARQAGKGDGAAGVSSPPTSPKTRKRSPRQRGRGREPI